MKIAAVMTKIALAVVAIQKNNFHKHNTFRIFYTRGVFLLYKKRVSKKVKKLRRLLLSVFLLMVAVIVYCEYQISDFKPEYIRIQAEILSVNSVCDAVNETLAEINYSYDDISKIRYDKDGNVKSISTDSFKINQIKSDVTKAVQREIAQVYDNEIQIPLGSFTDITVLSSFGPPITITFNLTGSFSSEIVSTFESAGINQTVHHIRLLLTSKIMTTSLDYEGKITFTTDFEIAQSVIVGEIPSAYGNLRGVYCDE